MSNIVIPDGGNIGSASDTDAIAIASDGGLTFSSGIDDAGTVSAGTLGSAVTGPQMQLVHLETQTVTATANLTFEGKLSSTYDTYMLLGSQIKPDTNNRRLGLQLGVGSAGSVTYRTTAYSAQVQKIESGSFGSVINEANVTEAIIGGYGNQGNDTNSYAYTQVHLFNTQNSSVRSMGSISAGGYKFNSDPDWIYSVGGFVLGDSTNSYTEAHTSIKILFGTSTYSLSDTGQGKFSLYGIKNG